jgi:flagellar biosynthesis/type III secretory pathway M-ring protein FliF/YscJ
MLADYSFGDFFWTMIAFFFWFMFIWIFITVFADIFHRNDIHGGAKAGWIILIVILPFIGILIYLIARPKMTEQDKQEREQALTVQQRVEGYSAADEVAKLAKLRDAGTISPEEYEELKRRAMMPIG